MPASHSTYSHILINTHMQGHCRARTHTHTRARAHGAHIDKECIDLWRELGGRLVIHLSGALRGSLGGLCHTPSMFNTGAQSFKRLPNNPFAILNYTFSPLHLYNFLIWLRQSAVKRAREAGECCQRLTDGSAVTSRHVSGQPYALTLLADYACNRIAFLLPFRH